MRTRWYVAVVALVTASSLAAPAAGTPVLHPEAGRTWATTVDPLKVAPQRFLQEAYADS